MKAFVFHFVLLPAIQNCLVVHDTLPPYASCACQFELIKNNEHGNELLSYFDDFHFNFSQYKLSQPIASDEECPTEFTCPNANDYKFYIGQNEAYRFSSWTYSYCQEEQKTWDISDDVTFRMFKTPYLFVVCVDFSSPLPASRLCNCPTQMITNSTGNQLNNFNINGQISEDRCSWEMSCRNGGMFQTRVNGEVLLSNKTIGECNMESKMWKVTSIEGNIWDDVPIFEYSCVNSS
ncbi:hypothetical protein CAEBREN_04539 [Caenorhabditis brenneri]|uniref:Uncharacterized protein n=1 Tax=Caenorhabditis brenneri TaxID=135651 RepID=G0NCK2_CAEBE|nr:hypothetical protein CAEBREN_04539 [Caenorhabditis brenneri]